MIPALPQHRPLLGLTLLLLYAAGASAQSPNWRVAAATASSGVRPAGFPADVSGYASQQLGASGLLSLRLSSPSAAQTLWTQTPDGSLRPIARPATADTLGPGRSGAEAGHVFDILWHEDYSVAAPFNLFAATAGPPGGGTTSFTVGLWLNDGTRNLEIARGGTDGLLGPNLGPNITLVSTLGGGNRALGRIQILPGNAFALGAQLDTPAGRRDVVLRRPFNGAFSACALQGSAEPALRPNVSGIEADQFRELNGLAQGAGGELYTFGIASLLVLSPNNAGIWRVCQGNPAGRALVRRRDVLGPGIAGSPRAEFLSFTSSLSPLGGGALLYAARARLDAEVSTSPLFDALFYSDGNGNRPLVAQAETGPRGPGIANHSYSGFTSFRGERVAALLADVRETGSTVDKRGLWRLSPDRPAEPVALTGASGTLAPAPGDVWLSFDDAVALANGDLITVATSRPNGVNTRAVWRFRPGHAPQRLLGPGDPVRYRDSGGIERSGLIERIDDLDGSQLPGYAGDEGWINADGQVAVEGRIQGNAATLVFQTGTALLDRDRLLQDGFEP
ncbi:MAG: hypothetical protein MUE46_13055 [Xanthomonadales bacterium]|jgi:hypothetical protein|nr:hypothetical protein [Xanthomonadales bacterium]